MGVLLAVHAGDVDLGLDDVGEQQLTGSIPIDAGATAIGLVVAAAVEDARELVGEDAALGLSRVSTLLPKNSPVSLIWPAPNVL